MPHFGTPLSKAYPFEGSPMLDHEESSDAFEHSWSSDEIPQQTTVHRAHLKFKSE